MMIAMLVLDHSGAMLHIVPNKKRIMVGVAD